MQRHYSFNKVSKASEFLHIYYYKLTHKPVNISVFLEEYKISKLEPRFKKGSKTDRKNYRPILLLPLVSKIIEKSNYYQLQDYLKEKGLLYKCHSRFRANFYIYLCLSQLRVYLLTGMNKGMHTGMILIDLQKAFDTLEH